MHPKDADGMANSVDPDQTAAGSSQTAAVSSLMKEQSDEGAV